MTSVADSLRSSTINITNISRSLFDTKRSVSSVNDSVSNISKIIATNTRIKRDLFTTSEIIGARRKEASKRQELEDQIESSKVSTTPSKGLDFAGRSDKGPLGRLLGFLGFMTAGWIVENLPTWIFMGQEFISRIQIFGKSMYNMVDNMKLTLNSFGKLLTTSFDSIVKLDFDEFTDGSVSQSFDELNLAVQNVGGDITETFRLFTTPLNKSLETGEEAPGLGEMRPDTMFPGVNQGGIESISKLIAKAETGGRYTAYAGDGGKGNQEITTMTLTQLRKKYGDYNTAVGAYQFMPGTAIGLAKQLGMDPNKTVFTPEIQDKLNQYHLKTMGYEKFKSGKLSQQEFGTRIAQQYRALPDPRTGRTYADQYAKDNAAQVSLNEFNTALNESRSRPSTTSTQVKPAPIVVTSGFGWRWGRQHQGIDIAPKTGKVEGTPVIIRKGGTVVYANIGRGNMGQVLITHEDGTQSRYLHVNNFRVKAGQKVSAGQTIAHLAGLGSPGIGNATGPHLHFEYYSSTSAPPTDPTGVYQNYVSLGGKVMGTPPKPLDPNQQSRAPDSAQITSPSRAAQPAAMTPDRKGSSVIFIDDTQSQISQTSYPSEQPSVIPTISEFKVLNNFIKNKLLLDLAYL
jgi:murein DD-endopeptidase MepM/ murein hydrolase activator NlpD